MELIIQRELRKIITYLKEDKIGKMFFKSISIHFEKELRSEVENNIQKLDYDDKLIRVVAENYTLWYKKRFCNAINELTNIVNLAKKVKKCNVPPEELNLSYTFANIKQVTFGRMFQILLNEYNLDAASMMADLNKILIFNQNFIEKTDASLIYNDDSIKEAIKDAVKGVE